MVIRPSVRLGAEPAVFFIVSDTREVLRQSASPMSRPGDIPTRVVDLSVVPTIARKSVWFGGQDAAAGVADAQLDPAVGTERPRISTVPSLGVCRIALVTRLSDPRQPGRVGGHQRPSSRAAEPDAARPGDRVGAGRSLGDQVAEHQPGSGLSAG